MREHNTNVMTAVRDAKERGRLRDTKAEANVTGREVESKPYVA